MQNLNEATKNKLTAIFMAGCELYKAGEPLPENRIKAMGWRYAKQAELELEIRLASVHEIFGELGRSPEWLDKE
ncbi:hypothetical protein 2AV2_149 [Nodularia phage vB_NpeS-2AV2]|jgi:hypothetical protein|uniref:Uncharacterized protein n=3 Tax=Ravarandavirus TaxID=2843444 RepID=A0A482MK38_9CAUD|nr:hypothetical protein HWA92_gp149 [Nodularia phage vB_NpeS-2AV2]YP_009844972.1 hypothetical protein HWC13_gp148 [Nodularia phage vB_NspS-kac68v161]ALY07601.1 hypothetical protein 2AV2_149 [Nodularia phage vB_NpeS-2AV2]QBQ73813.1 hypothetical protein kac68v161_gp163 [Nodularia phage vB_NspS-kac68v161]QBQ74009.1 hypothetical protein kac68v162_gp161 [Nodularia phage vB_NspS-kac68v162]